MLCKNSVVFRQLSSTEINKFVFRESFSEKSKPRDALLTENSLKENFLSSDL